MKYLLPVFLFVFCLFVDVAAQSDYQKFMHLSYAELDSLYYLEYDNGLYNKGIQYVQAAAEKAKKEFGEIDTTHAYYLAELGFCYKKTGQYKISEQLYLESLRIFEKTVGKKHLDFLGVLNNLAQMYHQIGNYEKAELFFIQLKNLGSLHPDYASFLNNLASLYQDVGKYDKAEPLFLESKNIRAKTLGLLDPLYAHSLNNLAYFYQEMGKFQEAEPLFLETKSIFEKTIGESHPDYAVCLNNLAYFYQEMNSYEKAESFFKQSISLSIKTWGEIHHETAITIANLAGLYSKMNNYKEAELLHLKAKSIREKILGKEHPDFALSLNSLGLLYKKMGEYEKSEQFYLQAKNIQAKIFGELHPDYATSLNNLAGLYHVMGQYAKAEELYLKTKNIRATISGTQHPIYSLILNNMAELYRDMGKLDTALQYSHQSIYALCKQMDSTVQDWTKLDEFHYTSTVNINNSIHVLLTILYTQFEKTGDKSKLELHYQIAQAAMRLNERIRNDFCGENDKLRSLAANSNFVLKTIKAGIELAKNGFQEEVFNFAEMNKAVLLIDAIRTSNAYQFGDLPESIATEEKKLQKKHADLEALLLRKKPQTEKDSLLNILNKTKIEIDKFTQNLRKKYPKYTSLKYANKSANAKEIQALLDDKTALLEYLIGDSVVYLFYVDKNNVDLFYKYIKTKELTDRIKGFHGLLSNYELATKQTSLSYQKYTENAFWFFENLVAPALKNAQNIQKLLIVSDGELGHLPFEAFLTKAAPQKLTDYHELSYLSNDYTISYNYSATLWKSIKEAKKNTNNGQILGMASNYEIKMDTSALRSTGRDLRLPFEQRLREGLGALPAAHKEIETLAEDFNGFFAFDKDASEKNFKTKAGDYAVIHLAMHGLLDAKNPILSSLAFTEDSDSLENNFLHAYEISKMKLNADLVILSACETGYGRFEKGNGIASLAQAFAYAGAPALIVSLWQVSDYATSEIMKNLYQNLADGMEKDEALRQAKIKYIKEAKGVLAHPAFWSPFILMGNTDVVDLQMKGGWFWWGIGIGVVALLGGFWWWQRKKS